MIEFFPSKIYSIKLEKDSGTSLMRLKENTLKKDHLSTELTEKRFIGRVGESDFKIISSVVGKGAFCVLQGNIDASTGSGTVSIAIHKAFRTLISKWCLLPFSIVVFCLFKGNWSSAFSLLAFVLIIRFIIIEILFKTLSRNSLDELVKVLGVAYLAEEEAE
ncbi:hypothetical protein [Desertivirga arenae]|uniref:hypothetical protein n=1 Tax=Desertivirga arenae TaxID=2810309 RepID=UPI001A9728C1|nr:hypothetical protein [Pedobacter sp. SYSU D00823]